MKKNIFNTYSTKTILLFCLSFTICIQATESSTVLQAVEKPRFIEGIDYIIINKDETNTNDTLNNPINSSTNIQSTGRIYDGIVTNFNLPEQTSKTALKRINSQYRWYKKNPEYMQRVWQRAHAYLYHITGELKKRNLPMELALLPIVESAYDSFAYSHGRAAGLWQIIPGTAKYLGVKQNWWYDGRRDVLDSTDAALDYLESLNRQFKGDWMLAIAAYNSGAGNVRKGIRRNKRKNKALDFWSLNLPKETKAYVPKLLALKKLFLEESTRTLLPAIPNQAHFEVIDIGSQIDLAKAAELARIDLDTLYQLNPGFNHWATAPKGPHRLLVPIESAALFSFEIKQLPDEQRIKLQRYKIKSGDTISVLAERNKTSIKAIQEANNLRGTTLRTGKYILIPQASTSLSAYGKTKDARLDRLQNVNRNGRRLEYKVKSGDSFWTIAKQHGVHERRLAKWNGMAPRDTLKIGQKLVIWVKDNSSVQSYKNTNLKTTRKINYKVKTGDTLSGIASKFKVKTSQLQTWNKNRIKKYLQPGQTLVLKVDVRQQSAP